MVASAAPVSIDANEHDRFILRQLIKPVINQYEFFLATESDEPGPPIAFVEQKRFSFKEDIRFFTGPDKASEAMRIKARQRFDPRARYDVTDPSGASIGEIQKAFGASLLRSTYVLYDAAGEEIARARERSLVVALIRRLVGIVPVIGDYADWLPIPYHFDFLRGDELLGTNSRRQLKFRDTYLIDMSGDPQRTIDRRLVLALAVGQDALQAR